MHRPASEFLVPRRGEGQRFVGLPPLDRQIHLREQDLNLAQRACNLGCSSIAAGRFDPRGWVTARNVKRGDLEILRRRVRFTSVVGGDTRRVQSFSVPGWGMSRAGEKLSAFHAAGKA